MSTNRFEISIKNGSDKKDAHLHEMSLEVAKAFLVLIESVTKIVETSLNKDKLRIKIEEGSVLVAIEGDGITEIKNNLFQSINQSVIDKEIVKPWRNIQNLIKANGLTYSSQFIIGDEKTSIIPLLRNASTIKAKRQKNPPLKTPIDFITGQLLQVGGKNPNIHIELKNGNKITIECSESQASAAKEYLYKDILISTWVEKKSDKKVHTLCESYYGDELELFNKMRDFIYEFETAEDEIASLNKLHFEVRRYLDDKDYRSFNKFLRLFDNKIINISILHTILMLCVSFKEQPLLKSTLEKLISLFRQKLTNLTKNNRSAVQETDQGE